MTGPEDRDRDGWSLDDLFGPPAEERPPAGPGSADTGPRRPEYQPGDYPPGRPDGFTGPTFPPPPGVQPLRPRSVDSALQPPQQFPPPQPPSTQQASPQQPAQQPPVRRTRRPMRGPQVVVIAAVTALLVGGLGGFGGALAAGWRPGTDAGVAAPSAPTEPGRSNAPPVPADPPPDPTGPDDTVGIASKVLPSTVTISVTGTQRSSSGSGFVLDTEGRIMTNNHVVEGAAESGSLQVDFSDGTRAKAEIVGRSPSYDLAVIQVKDGEHLTPSDIGDSDATEVGEGAVAVGSPLGLGGTVTRGIISATGRPVVVGGSADGKDASAYINAVQTDAPINPGNSGGPLVDGAGRVIGVNSAILSTGGGDQQAGSIGLGFAIPINQAMEIGEMLIKDGKATYPVIGATVTTVGDEEGVELQEVNGGSPAEDAGLRSGDVIRTLNGEPVTEMVELIVAIRTHRPGEVVTLGYARNGANKEAEVTLGSKEG